MEKRKIEKRREELIRLVRKRLSSWLFITKNWWGKGKEEKAKLG